MRIHGRVRHLTIQLETKQTIQQWQQQQQQQQQQHKVTLAIKLIGPEY